LNTEFTITGDLHHDMEVYTKKEKTESVYRWKWEMPLRAINHHVGKLESVTIVCSDKSIRQVGWFEVPLI
jgi:hypothetical protein